VENIFTVYQRPRVLQVSVVQSDLLAFVARVQTDATPQRIAKLHPQVSQAGHRRGRRAAHPEIDPIMDAIREMLRD